MALELGDPAPSFALRDQHGRTFDSEAVLGAHPVVLVFLPLAFSPTCTGELQELRGLTDAFREAGVELAAVTVDSVATLRAWGDAEGIRFPLLSDFWPHGAVASRYGVLDAARGTAERVTLAIDTDRTIRARFGTPDAEARPSAAYLAALEELARDRT